MGRSLTTLIVAAHPDDEVLGAGIWIHRHPGTSVHIVHITDGSPRNTRTARDLGFRDRKSYARARRRELADALSLAGVPSARCTQLTFVDQEAYLHLPEMIDEVDALIARLRPDQVFSPAYEGGHPDHDAAALVVAAVRARKESFAHWEFPLYHSGPRGRMITGTFVDGGSRRESVVSFTREERLLKLRMLDCFPTQRGILSRFKVNGERMRRARKYDFSKPPHAGPLLYERWGWKITGEDWRGYAVEVLPGRRPSRR